MAKFRKRPVVIEAEQFRGYAYRLPFAPVFSPMCWDDGGFWYVETLEGPLKVSEGDWIIRGVKGEFYPCKPDIFEMTYEPVDEPTPYKMRHPEAG